MADGIGYMGDRIVTTDGIVAGVAHKMLDTNKPSQPAMQQQGWGYAPAPTPMPPVTQSYPAANRVLAYGFAA